MNKDFNKRNSGVLSDALINIVAGLFILLFIYTAASKLMTYDETLSQLSKSPITTDFASLLVWLIPALEIVISALLAFRRTLLAGLFSACLLMSAFSIYIGLIQSGDYIPCSCGGFTRYLSWTGHLIFNGVFILLSGTAIFLKIKSRLNRPEGQ